MTRRIHFVVGAGLLGLASFSVVAQERGAVARAEDKQVVAFADVRTPIALSDEERAFIRREMREFLAGLQEILDASGARDHVRVMAAARRVGMNGPEKDHIPKSLAPKLPAEFKQLGLATHRAFDQIATAAEQRGAADLTPKQLGELMRNCVACHGTWRITGERAR